MPTAATRADGVYRWFHVHGLPMRDAEGRIVRWFVLQTDLEDRKQAEVRKAAILESALDCIVTIDHEGRISEFARDLATGEAHMIGRRIETTAVHADGREFPVELTITRIPLEGPPSLQAS
jgi:hypothetical protein